MTKWSLKQTRSTLRRTVIPSALSLVIAGTISGTPVHFAKANTSPGNSTQALPKSDPVVEASGTVRQIIPQVEGKDQTTFMAAAIDFNLHKTQRTLTQFELSLDGTKLWSDNPEASKAKLDTTELYLQQTYTTDDPDTSITYGLKSALPSNESDRDAGFNYGAGGILALATKLGIVTVILDIEPMAYNYKWDTSTEAGDEFNNRNSVYYMTKAIVPMGKSFAWRTQGSIFQYTNFADNTYNKASLSTSVAWKAAKAFSPYFGASTTSRLDKTAATQKALSREMVNLRVGFEWSL